MKVSGRKVISCPNCSGQLRIPVGKAGIIRCGHCQFLFEANTTDSADLESREDSSELEELSQRETQFWFESKPLLSRGKVIVVACLVLFVIVYPDMAARVGAGILTALVAVKGKHISNVAEGIAVGTGKHIDDLAGSSMSVAKGVAQTTIQLAKVQHNKSCPNVRLRASLPQLNVSAAIPKDLNIRAGPDENVYAALGRFSGGAYVIDILGEQGCWLYIRMREIEGWISARYLTFEFDDQMAMPIDRQDKEITLEDLHRKVSPSVYMVISHGDNDEDDSQGSAVAVSERVLLTNCHVVSDSKRIYVLSSGRRYEARVVHSDLATDACFLLADGVDFRPVPFVTPVVEIVPGQRIITIGTPMGFERSISEGIVSGIRQSGNLTLIQFTAPISPGSSGGGLFDTKGNLLGITTFGIEGGENLNFAIAAQNYWK